MLAPAKIVILLSALLTALLASGQTDTGPYPPSTAPRKKDAPQQPPWNLPGAVCSATTPQKQDGARSQESLQIVSPLAHLNQVNAISDIADLNYAVTASNDGTIRIWDSGTGDQVGVLFSDYTRRVVDVAARPKHSTEIAAAITASGLRDSRVAIFDLTTDHARTLCSGGVVKQIRFSSDGSTLAVLDQSSVSLWNIGTFALIRRINGPRIAIDFSDNSTLAMHTQDAIELADVRTDKSKGSIPTGVGTSFIIDEREGLLFHLNKKTLSVWSLPSSTQPTATSINTLQLFSEVQLLAVDPDHRALYASGFESMFGGGTKYIYRISGSNWDKVEGFLGPNDRITALAVARGDLMVGEYDGEVRRFNVRNNFEVEADLGVRAEDITSIATSAEDHYIAVGDRSGVISVWETDSGAYRQLDQFGAHKSLAPFFPATGVGVGEQFTMGEPSPPPFLKVLNMAFLGDSTLLAIAYGSGHTLVLDVLSRQIFVNATISDVGLTNFASIDKRVLFVGSADQVHWWNLETGKSGTFATDLHGLSSLSLTPDNKSLIVAGQSGLQVFDAIGFAPTGPTLHPGPMGSLIAVPTGDRSVAAISVSQLLTWNFGTPSPAISTLDRGIPKTLAPDFREEYSFQISPTQRRIVLTGYGIHIWDYKTPNVLRRLEAGFSVTAVAMTADGRTVVAGGRDGRIGFIDVASGRRLGDLFAASPLGWYAYTVHGFFDASPLLWDRLFFASTGSGLATLRSSDMFARHLLPNKIPQLLIQHPLAPNDTLPGSSPVDVFPRNAIPPQVEITSPRPTVKIGHGVLQELTATRRGTSTSMVFRRPQPQGSLVESMPRVVDSHVTVTLQITDRGAGVSSCKLFRNSHLIHSFAAFPANERNILQSWAAEMLPGTVEFSAYCFDKYGNRSRVARSTLIGDDKLRGTRHAFIVSVGIGDYEKDGLHLKFAQSDADLFADTVYSKLSITHEYDSVSRTTLCDADATDANILAALQLLAGTYRGNKSLLPKQIRDLPVAAAQDTVFFYFSGHGKKSGSRYFLLAHNFRLDLASGGVSGAVSDLELTKVLEALNAAQVIVVLDACESGAPLEARVGPFNFKGFAQMAYDKGIFVISATQSTSDAHESDDLCHAQFTYILVEDGLVSTLADWRPVDKLITAKEWLQYGAENGAPVTPNKNCAQPPGSIPLGAAPAKHTGQTKRLWEQTPRLFLPDIYSGFDFTVSDLRIPPK